MVGRRNSETIPLTYILGLFLAAFVVLLAFSLFYQPKCIGVVRIKGPLITEDIPPTIFTSEQKGSQTIAKELKEAALRKDVSAVLIFIDSPGGSVVASQEIYSAIRAMNKTAVAFIREIATSGGYYVAVGADYIVANPDALTGSIGARAIVEDYSGLMAKLGINVTAFKTGEMKDMGAPYREMSEKEREIWKSLVEESFLSFKKAVEERRAGRLDEEGFKEVLDARVLTGRQAKKIGLVDMLGNEEDAISYTAKLAGLEENPRLCEISPKRTQRSIFGFAEAALSYFMQPQAPRLHYQ